MDIVLLVAAVAPAIALAILLYKKDTADKEPVRLVATCFALGAVAVIPIATCELVASSVLEIVLDSNSPLYLVLEMTLGVALIEELFKLLAALIPTWKSNAFNYVFDGVLYCAVAALGYACLENIMYVLEGGIETALVRAVMSVPSHMVDGIFMGVFVGYAKYHKYHGSKGKMRTCLALSLIIPIAEHGAFDTLATLESDAAFVALLLLLLVEYGVAAVIVKKRHGKNDIPIFDGQQSGAYSKAGAAATPVSSLTTGDSDSAQPASPATNPRSRFCCECGSSLPVAANFCPRCGRKIAS